MSKSIMSRWYFGILYEDSGMETLQVVRSCTHALIWHDGEKTEDGEEKKKHCHYLVYFENARRHSAVASFLKTEERLVKPSRTPDENIRYLIHADNPEKKQYDPSDIEYSIELSRRVANAYKDRADCVSEDQKALQVIELLHQLSVYCSFTDFMVACCQAGLYGTFRAMGANAHYIWKEYRLVYSGTSDFMEGVSSEKNS